MEVTGLAKLAHVVELTVAQMFRTAYVVVCVGGSRLTEVSDGVDGVDRADGRGGADGATDAPPTAGAAVCVGGI